MNVFHQEKLVPSCLVVSLAKLSQVGEIVVVFPDRWWFGFPSENLGKKHWKVIGAHYEL